jgi:hypothetical protein
LKEGQLRGWLFFFIALQEDRLEVLPEAQDPQPGADEVQVFPDYDGADPEPVYD